MKYFTILLAMVAALGLAACNEDDKASGDGKDSKSEMSDTAKQGAGSGDKAKTTETKMDAGHPNAGRYVDGP